MKDVAISVVIPVLDEVDNIAPLHERLCAVLDELAQSYEILFVDDGSTDGTFERIAERARQDPAVRAIRFRRNFGKAAALAVAFREVRGETIITMDGDLQDDPREIPGFLAELAGGYDLVSGWKRERHDPLSKTWPSRVSPATRFHR